MDFLGDILEPYSPIISKIAGTITCLQFLSGAFMLNQIRKVGKSDSFTPDPFIGGSVLTLLTLKFGYIMQDPTMILVNIIGIVINASFTIYFYLYASNEFRKQIHKRIAIASTVLAAILAYAAVEDPKLLVPRFGFIITSILVFLVGSPLLKIKEIIRNKSTAGFPVPIIITGTLVSASWATYGLSIRNPVVVYQNALLLSLGTIQLVLIALYPGKPHQSKRQKAKKVN